MKSKRILALLLSLSLLFSFASCGKNNDSDPTNENKITNTTVEESTNSAETESTPSTDGTSIPTNSVKPDKPTTPHKPDNGTANTPDTITPLLYKVTDSNGNSIWLFGSIHVGKDYFYPLPDYVMNAYNSSDAIAVEFDVLAAEKDISGMVTAMMPMMYSDGSSISDHIPEELYNDAKAALKDCGIYNVMLDRYRPIMWSSFIDSMLVEKLGYDAMMGIDYHFLNKAHNESKKIYDIESMEMQFELLGGFSDKLQILLLEESVESYNTKEEYKKSLEALAVAWSTGNEAEFERLNSETSFSNEEEKKLYNEYSSKMVTERNINMANYAEDALSSGEEVFICVGAAHVIGDGAMADLLEERGYTIEVIKG